VLADKPTDRQTETDSIENIITLVASLGNKNKARLCKVKNFEFKVKPMMRPNITGWSSSF